MVQFADPRPASIQLSPKAALALPAGLSFLLGLLALPIARQHPRVAAAFAEAGGVLVMLAFILYHSARRTNRVFTLEIAVRKQHWMQACAQGTVLLYWGWHTPLVVAFAPFILAQLIFAYAFDSLLSWSRRDTYSLGFGPFPVVFSINLFLWFRLGWFDWQFVMIAVGFAAKELIRWTRNGKKVHIFNPSSFPLAVASLCLLLTGTSNATFGQVIADTQFDTPNMYLVIFLVALPGQLLFGVARMTLAAVVTMYVAGVAYFHATGTYFFYDTFIPVPVFLGMHLLFTDPSTSPRTGLGRIIFGMLYALMTMAFFVILSALGAPTFYDKLLPLPLLNLSVRLIDRLTMPKSLAGGAPFPPVAPAPLPSNVMYTSIWAVVFAALYAAKGIGDTHPGQYLPFWQNACQNGSIRACRYAATLTEIYCANGSGWACNEVGVLRSILKLSSSANFKRACELGFAPGCENVNRSGDVGSTSSDGTGWKRDVPQLKDLPIVLRGTKPVLREREPAKLYALACEQGWPGMCGGR